MSKKALMRAIGDSLTEAPTQEEKLTILSKYEKEPLLESIVKYAYNPLIQFDMDDWTPAKDGKMHGMGIPKFLHLFEDIANKKFDHDEAIFSCNLAVTHMDEQQVPIFVGVMKKNLQWGLTAETINKVWDGLIADYPVQHPTEYSDESIKEIAFPCVAQQFVDGYRINIIVRDSHVDFKDSTGSPVHYFDSFKEQFITLTQNGTTVFDGCAVVVDDNRNVVGTDLEDIETADPKYIRFFLWDSVRYDGWIECKDTRIGYNWRFNGIEHMMFLAADKNTSPCYALPSTEVVGDFEQAKAFAERNNWDIVLKDFAGTWRAGITPHEIVYKR